MIARLLILLLVALAGCGSELDTFHVVRGGVALPVVVRGPRNADTLLVFQHGGPGGEGLDSVYEFERRLQRRFLYVSWAQRTTALATGEVRRSNSALADHYADFGAVLGVLRARYPDKRIVAVGYSFGGIITLGHLGGMGAKQVDGVVLIDAPLSGRVTEAEDFALLDAFAEEQIAAGHDRVTWQEFRELAAEQPRAFEELSARHYFERFSRRRAARCEAMQRVLDIDKVPGPVEQAGEINPAAPLLLPGVWVGQLALDWMGPELAHFDLTEEARRLRVPTLLLWGAQDCMVAPAVAEQLLQDLGSDAKALHLQEGAGHFMPYQQPAFVANEIEAFVDAL